MFCTNCGASIPDGSMFCTNCGAATAAAAATQAQPYQQPSYTKQAQTVTKQQPADQQAQYQQQYQQAQYQQPYQGQPYQQQPYQEQPYQGQYQQPYQGQYQQPYQGQGYAQVSSKSKIAAGLFAIFLGAFGVHKFYLGYTKAAVIMLVVTLVGAIFVIGPLVMGIIGLIEGIMYLTKTDQEFYNIYIAGQKEWF